MTPTQIRHLTAAVPAGLPCPGTVGGEACQALVAERWPTLPPLDRFAVARIFGRSAERAAVEPCMMLLRTWGVPIRDVLALVADAGVRECCERKLDYTNRR